MKKCLFLFLGLISLVCLGQGGYFSQYKNGEKLSYRIHYSGLSAGTAEISSKLTSLYGKPHLYVQGVGRTTGAVRAFFKVEDMYESYINMNTGLPTFFVRNVSEGSYRQYLTSQFNHSTNNLKLTNKLLKTNNTRNISFSRGMQDMLSAFFYLRSKSTAVLVPGAVINLNVWIDDEVFPFSLKVVKRENIKTKFGIVKSLKITPYVKSGRVFKSKEGVSIWVTDDAQHIPISIKAELAVGSLQADIIGISGNNLSVIKK